MDSEIRISKDELYKLIRVAVRDELNEINEMSLDERKELEHLYGDSLEKEDYVEENCVRL